jgi:4'-phosphopantetheinyl transferase
MGDVITIGPQQAHLWVVDPCELARVGHLSGYLRILSPAERERMQRFYREQDRVEFLAAHGLARVALSSCVPSVPPEAWEFISTERGRPEVVAPHVGPVLRFNISHTRRLVACLVTAQIDCGVDVETLDRPIDVIRLASKVLSRAEQAVLLAASGHMRHKLFFKYWTLKEALVKATAHGISMPLDKCTFEFHSEGIRATFDCSFKDDPTEWQFFQRSPTERHVLAVALRCGRAVRCRIVEHLPSNLA